MWFRDRNQECFAWCLGTLAVSWCLHCWDLTTANGVTVVREEQLCNFQEWWLGNGTGRSVFLTNSVIPGGRRARGRWQKGQFRWKSGKVGSNRLWFFRQVISTRKNRNYLPPSCLKEHVQKASSLPSPSSLEKLSHHFPPFVCAQLPGQRLWLGVVYPAALVRLSNSRHAACLPLGSKWYCLSDSHTPQVWLCQSAFIAHPLTINLPGIRMPLLYSYSIEYVLYIHPVYLIFCSYKNTYILVIQYRQHHSISLSSSASFLVLVFILSSPRNKTHLLAAVARIVNRFLALLNFIKPGGLIVPS